jgi:predicted nucleotidyltransferase
MPMLLGSALRQKLLAYAFTHPNENYYVRELAALIDEDPGNLSRELIRLEHEGLFTSFTRGRARFYSLDRKYPLFKELKSIVFKTVGVEGSLKELVMRFNGIALAFIHGSYAKGKEKKTSDVDLVIVGEFDLNKFTREVRTLEGRLSREINFVHYSERDFATESAKDGGFLNLVLKGKVVTLKGNIQCPKDLSGNLSGKARSRGRKPE